MKYVKIALAGLIAITALACEQETTSTNDWFIGGTLHKSTVREWNNATEEDKLATCADWICAWERSDLTTRKYDSMDQVKWDAEELRACLNEALLPISLNEPLNFYAVVSATALKILRAENAERIRQEESQPATGDLAIYRYMHKEMDEYAMSNNGEFPIEEQDKFFKRFSEQFGRSVQDLESLYLNKPK